MSDFQIRLDDGVTLSLGWDIALPGNDTTVFVLRGAVLSLGPQFKTMDRLIEEVRKYARDIPLAPIKPRATLPYWRRFERKGRPR